MYIEGRKSKPYSEALYNELLLLTMLINGVNDLPSYILNNTFHKSNRTYRRYFKELNDCGLVPEIVSRRIKHQNNEFTCYIPDSNDDPFNDKDDLLEYLVSYSKVHGNNSSRLFRCGMIIITSFEKCYWEDGYYLEDDDTDDLDLSDLDMTNTYLVGGLFYHVELSVYAELYEGLSLRSRQRDLKLVKQVVLDGLVLSDKFG